MENRFLFIALFIICTLTPWTLAINMGYSDDTIALLCVIAGLFGARGITCFFAIYDAKIKASKRNQQ